MLAPIAYQHNNPKFGLNLNSRKLNFKPEDFYVSIRGYGKNSEWAKIVINTADESSNFIRNGLSFENVLKKISLGVINANNLLLNLAKRNHTGFLRTPREGWKYSSDWEGYSLTTSYERGRYKCYAERLDYTAKNKLKNPYKDISLSIPINNTSCNKYILHAAPSYINSAFKRTNDIFLSFYNKFIKNEVNDINKDELNAMVAEIRWILAHATPWERGSDAISNVLMRAMYKSAGVKSYPIKKGISLDLEAYCTELSNYKKNFSSYFDKTPEIIE